MGAKIECYLDIASYYSYIAFIQLQQNKELLRQHGVEVELHPFLIGAVNAASGNQPPWVVPAKAEHSKYDTRRAAAAVGLKDASPPGNLMEAGRTIVPMRALTYIRTTFPLEAYTKAFAYLLHSFWTLHKVPNSSAILAEVLGEIPADFELDCLRPDNANSNSASDSNTKDKKLFTSSQITQILQATESAAVKGALRARVDEAVGRGAFGAPWIWATNNGGAAEPFFGSDRWHAVYEFLGLPYQKVVLLPPSSQQQQQQQRGNAKL